MTEFASDKKKIAKNTMFLYIRMLLVMIIAFYTSRVVLETLGVTDFGVYNVVGGVVAMMSFINGPLQVATIRFLTFEIGRDNQDGFAKTFATALNLHIIIGILAIVLGETIGLWFFYNKLVIPDERLNVAFWVYQFSLINCLFTFTQVPYTAAINSHEKMSIYAYVGLYEAISNLLIVYAITISSWDKLFIYSLLIMLNKIVIQLYYRFYTGRHFDGCKFTIQRDYSIYKKLSSYAGWEMFGGAAVVCEGQGVNILLNLFFGPVVNAARAIAMQVRSAIVLFLNNLLLAVRPQVVKSYANNQFDEMYTLTFATTKFSFFLMLVLVLPVCFEVNTILKIWLGDSIPHYTSFFIVLTLIIVLIDTIDKSLLLSFHAIGNVKFGNIVGGTLMISSLPISYICLKIGFTPYIVYYVVIVINIIATVFDFFLIHSYVSFSIKRFLFNVLIPILIVSGLSLIIPFIIICNMDESITRFICNTILMELGVLLAIWVAGMDNKERQYIINYIHRFIHSLSIA